MTEEDKIIEAKRDADILQIAGVETRLKVAFWGWYLDPTSPTLMNAAASARKAGFSEEQAGAITNYKWFKRSLLKDEIYSSAEKVLQEMLNLSTITTKMNKDGETFTNEDPTLIKIKQDTAKFIASTLGKKDYSQRNELTGKHGGAIETKKTPVSDDEFDDILKRYADKRNNREPKDRDPA